MKVEPISISHIVAEADGVIGGGQLGGQLVNPLFTIFQFSINSIITENYSFLFTKL